VLVGDRRPGHISTRMRTLTAARAWLRVYHRPSYAPELNPVENVWSNVRRGRANPAPGTVTDLARTAKNRLNACSTGRHWSTPSSPPPAITALTSTSELQPHQILIYEGR
jgi:transposase